MLKKINIKEKIVQDLCPNIVDSEKFMRIADLSSFLEAKNAQVRKHNNKYICIFGTAQVSFDEEPTAELLERYKQEPEDYSRQIAAVEDLMKEITTKSEKTNPFRIVRTCRTISKTTPTPDLYVNGRYVKQVPKISVVHDYHEHPPCKNCKGRDYIDCTTHWTCRKCAVVRDKIHEGVAYREMRDREVDMNGRGMEINTLYSEGFHRQTDVLLTKKTREWEKLQTMNARMNSSRRDTQMFAAREKIADVCDRWHLSDGIAKKAHILFCKHRKTVSVLRSENAVLAACIFYCLPKEVPVYKKKKKRPLSPWKETKRKKLKVMNFKKPLNFKGKRRYSVFSKLRQKKAI